MKTCCIRCGSEKNLTLLPHVANGHIVGWVIACEDCIDELIDRTVTIEVRDDSRADS